MRNATFALRVEYLRKSLKHCVLCPRMCRADRTTDEKGFCHLDTEMAISSALPHYGEEPPLSGSRGAGTIFFSSCNLKCIYCQNYQISHFPPGQSISVDDLAGIMLKLQELGCHNIEPVTPTPHLPGIMAALLIARGRGLHLPLIFNCGGYEREKIVRFLDGMVDIYLPDFKYGLDKEGERCSGVPDYSRNALASLREMIRQVGDRLEIEDGIAKRGILVRHLVLPGKVDNSMAVLKMIRDLSPFIPLSLMSQFTPIPAVRHHPFFGRRVMREEYEQVVNAAFDFGFEELYTQEVDNRAINPNFELEKPFDWKKK